MEQQLLEKLSAQACDLVKEVGLFIKKELGKVQMQEIEVKALNSLVSYVDKDAERQLVEGLAKLIEGATFLTEEETIEQASGMYQWIIDPLDGTTNFLHQLPFFSISVALRYREEIVLGIVYEVNRGECFYAWKGGGAFLNDRSIQVTKTQELADSLIATGFPYYDYDSIKAYLAVLETLMQGTRGIRRLGSAALDLAYVACGRFDAYFEYSLNAWDVAAGIILVQEAGGVISDFQGQDDYLFGKQMVASNRELQADFLPLIRQNFYPMT